LANKLESLGDGPAAEWHLPSMADLRTLLNGWKPEDGSRKNWLQAKSGSDPATCKPVTAGSGEAVTMANACVWPDDPNLWSDQFRGTLEDIRQNDEGYWAKVRTYIYGWGYTFLNVNDDTQPECFNFTGLLDWNDLGGQDYEFDPRGHTRAWPASGACGGSMVLERTLPAAEARKYYFAL
jgi:hypothetical protein